MTASAEPGTVALSLILTANLAQTLVSNSSPNFYDEQPGRFELIGGFDLPLPTDGVFVGGTMSWCDGATNALLFRAYEEACGHSATLLWDLAGFGGGRAVLSSRRFRESAA